MSDAAIALLVLGGLAITILPRRWAALPLLAGACYMTLGQRINVGPFTFTFLRVVIAIGLVRATLRRERLPGGLNRLDLLIVGWGIWAVFASTFHEDVGATLVAQLGSVYNAWGIYFLLRVFCSTEENILGVARIAAIVLFPVAVEMLYEQVALHNLFSLLGGVPDTPPLREGRIRALGPFAHPILAGSVGGVTLPLMAGLWRHHRAAAIIGGAACVTMVLASGSSGPIVTLFVSIGSIAMWPFRRYMRQLRWMTAGVLLVLIFAMERPPYYIIQHFELFGGSTGWYRSRLIEAAFEHIDAWWLAGTDYTRHWMPDTNAINERHTDITNHYLGFCVTGGLPLLILHLSVLITAFSFVRQVWSERTDTTSRSGFLSWLFGCALFAHAVTNISVAYFDQSVLFLYLTIAAISSLHAVRHSDEVRQWTPVTMCEAAREVRCRQGRWRRRPVSGWRLKPATREITNSEGKCISAWRRVRARASIAR